MNNPHTPQVELSQIAIQRRDRMLEELLVEVRRVRRTRRRRRHVVIPLLLITIALAGRWLYPTQTAHVHHQAQRPTTPRDTHSSSSSAATLAVVRTNADVLERYRAASSAHAQTLNDDELLATLAALDRPTGIVRTGERVWLTRQVSDEPRDGA